MNLSSSGPHDHEINALVDAASAIGILSIAAAGNQNQSAPRSPASAASAISVAAAKIPTLVLAGQPPFEREENSNYGASVDIFAPGDNITSSWNNGRYWIDSGTSMASPFVAGVAAYLIAHNPNLNTPALLKARILGTARPGLILNPGQYTTNRFLYNGSGQ